MQHDSHRLLHALLSCARSGPKVVGPLYTLSLNHEDEHQRISETVVLCSLAAEPARLLEVAVPAGVRRVEQANHAGISPVADQ